MPKPRKHLLRSVVRFLVHPVQTILVTTVGWHCVSHTIWLGNGFDGPEEQPLNSSGTDNEGSSLQSTLKLKKKGGGI